MNTPVSVHIVVALEWILGCFTGIYCLMFLLVALSGLHVSLTERLLTVGLAIVMAAITVTAFLTGQSLRNGRKWAWHTSWAIGTFVMLFGGWSLYDLFYGKVHGPDDYFALIMGPLLILYGLAWMILLLLPQTRRYLDERLEDGREPAC